MQIYHTGRRSNRTRNTDTGAKIKLHFKYSTTVTDTQQPHSLTAIKTPRMETNENPTNGLTAGTNSQMDGSDTRD